MARVGKSEPGLIAVVAVIVAIVLAGCGAGGDEDDKERYLGDASTCSDEQPDPTTNAGGGFRFAPVSSADQQLLEEELAKQLQAPSDVVIVRDVLAGGKSVGLVMIVPGSGDESRREDFAKGFREGAADSGAPASSVEVEDEPGLLINLQGLTELATYSGCYAVVAASVDEAVAHAVARELVLAGRN